MSLAVLYNSTYGSTERYAREFAQRHGVQAQELAQVDLAPEVTDIVVFSPNYAGQVSGAKWLAGQELAGKRSALAIVGMTLIDEARAKDGVAGALGDKADQITRFYLPGCLAYSKLSRVHKATMWTMNKMLKAKKDRSENEEAMLRGYNTDEDRVDFAELDAIDRWLNA
ncbi:flavodoxin domain-containing protein [Corynebacterium sp. H130]|uniref:flavodoxin domain-containing protein n=1 Tax=Corynebacterium sp. H130 TaxID=3133444 RepID=UPI0030AEBEAF